MRAACPGTFLFDDAAVQQVVRGLEGRHRAIGSRRTVVPATARLYLLSGRDQAVAAGERFRCRGIVDHMLFLGGVYVDY